MTDQVNNSIILQMIKCLSELFLRDCLILLNCVWDSRHIAFLQFSLQEIEEV